MEKPINQRLANTEVFRFRRPINRRLSNTDIFVFNYEPQTALFTYSRPFTAEEAASLAEETNDVIASLYGEAKAIWGRLIPEANVLSARNIGRAILKCPSKDRIKLIRDIISASIDELKSKLLKSGCKISNYELSNMCTLTGISLNKVLMKKTNNQQWLPTIKEGIQLQRRGMLASGGLTDFGLALYDGQDDGQSLDKEIAQALSATAAEKGYIAPVLASFKSLDLVNGGERYGITPQIVSTDGLIFGYEAKELLDKNSFRKKNSGACRLFLDMYDKWGADWDGGLGFLGSRAGRLSAVGDAQKMQEEASGVPIEKSLDSLLRFHGSAA